MLKVYNKGTVDFNNLGFGTLHEAYDVVIEKEINVPPVLKFNMPRWSIKGGFEPDSIIDCEGQRFIFKAKEQIDAENEKVIHYTALSLYEAEGSQHFIPNIPDTPGTSPFAMMSIIWQGTGFNLVPEGTLNSKGLSWVTTLFDWWSVDKTNPVIATQILMQNIGRGELYIDNYNIAIVQALGKDEGVTLTPSKSIKAMTYTNDITNVITRLWAFGRDDLPLPEPGYIDSPLIDTVGVKEGYMDFPDIVDPYDLYDRAIWEFSAFNNQRIDVGERSYTGTIVKPPKVNGIDTMSLDLGDTVKVMNIFAGVYDVLRIVKMSYYPYTPNETIFTLGKPPKSVRDFFRRWKQTEQIVSQITDTTGKVTPSGVADADKNLIPPGGDLGWVLTKRSFLDGDTMWYPPQGGGGGGDPLEFEKVKTITKLMDGFQLTLDDGNNTIVKYTEQAIVGGVKLTSSLGGTVTIYYEQEE